MQPVAVRRPVQPGTADDVVLVMRATGQERLRAALRRIAAAPEVLDRLRRVVVIDAGATPSTTVLREAVRLPAGLLRVVRAPEASAPEALSLGLLEALDDAAADVIVVDDDALADATVLSAALDARCPATGVIGLRDPRALDRGPASWWAAVLPVDAIRAVGAALPEAGAVALADLVLRADAAGFRSAVVAAPGPVPEVDETDRVLLELLHGADEGVPRAVRVGFAEDLRLLLGLRFGALRARRAALRDLLTGLGEERITLPRVRLALAWSSLRRRVRAGALDRADASAWVERLGRDRMNGGLPRAEREASDERSVAVRLPAWPTTRRTSAA